MHPQASRLRFDFFTLLAAFTSYYLTERCLRYLISVHIHRPDFRHNLRSSSKESAYYGILMTIFISLFSFPFCATALWQNITPFSKQGPLGAAAEICIVTRGVGWVSELNRVDIFPSYVYHHLGSIAVLFAASHFNLLELLVFPFTTLVSEVPGQLVRLLSVHQQMDSRLIECMQWERRKEKLKIVNMWIYGLTRVPSIPVIAYSIILWTRRDDALWNMTWLSTITFLALVFVFLSGYSGWIAMYLGKQWQHTLRKSKASSNYGLVESKDV